jgi:hypothetical protein
MMLHPGTSATAQPFQTGTVVNFQPGQASQQPTLVHVPPAKWLVLECIGINAFAQPGQSWVMALEVTTSGHPGTYPIALLGSSTMADPDFPARSFGSQLLRLYAAPTTAVMLPISRSPVQGSARVIVDLSGYLLDA